MKIAIVGAGWLGCHTGLKLKQDAHIVKIFDKAQIFSGSSYYNQNRLHKGFHYSRNSKTRNLCYNTFNKFYEDYNHLVTDVPKNYYVIPNNKSIIDYQTYINTFKYDKIPFIESSLPILTDIEGSIIVDEKHINPYKAKNYFHSKLKDNFTKEQISKNRLDQLIEEFDLVVNTTNNFLHPITDHYYEVSLVLIYDKKASIPFGAITMVDGPFFSIYPFVEDQYTLTDVEYTPIYTSMCVNDINNFIKNIKNNTIQQKIKLIEDKVKYYYKDFEKHFKYNKYYLSIKVKKITESADRYPTIIQEGNLISCTTGKIQGIYTL